jgi:hypothetical protein
VLFQDVCNVYQVVVSQLRLNKRPFGDHHLIFMALTLGQECIWDCKVNPIFWLLWKDILIWHSNLVVCEYLIEILLSTFRIVVCESKLLNLTLVFIKENGSIKCLVSLLPHFHDKEMSIESILSLLVGIW